jgi:WD40 repeat protein
MRSVQALTICVTLVAGGVKWGVPLIAAARPNDEAGPEQPIARLGSHRFVNPSSIESLGFTGDGSAIYAVSSAQTCLWDVATGQPLSTLKSQVAATELSQAGRTALKASNERVIEVVIAATGRHVAKLESTQGRCWCVEVSPNGQRVAVAGDGQVVLRDVTTGRKLRSWETSSDYVHAIRFSPDGRRLAVAVDHAEMRIFDVEGNQPFVPLAGGTGFTGWLVFSPDGKTVAGSCEVPIPRGHRSSLRIWDAATGRPRHIVPGTFNCGAFSPDGKRLAANTLHTVRIYDAVSAQPLHSLPERNERISGLAFSPDGKILATGQGRRIRLWDTQAWHEINPGSGHAEPVQAVAFSPDGRTIATGGLDGVAMLWSWPAGRERCRIEGVGSRWGVQHLTFSPDARTLAATAWKNWDNTFFLFNSATGKAIAEFGKEHQGKSPVAFLSGGQEVLTGQLDGTLAVWNASTGEFVRSVGESRNRICAVRLGTDTGTAWWASEHQGTGLRDLATGKDLRVFDMPSSSSHLAVPPHESWVARGYHVWNPETGEVLGKGRGDAAAVSPDGRLLAIGKLSGGITFWEALTRQEIHTLATGSGKTRSLAFSPDGTVLAAAGYTDTLVWDITGRLQDGRLPALDLTSAETDSLWQALGEDDAWAAHQSAWTLAAGGKGAVAFLSKRLRPAPVPSPELVQSLRDRVSDGDYDARELAARKLVDLGIGVTLGQMEALRRPAPPPAFGGFGEPPPVRFLPPPVLLPLPERVRTSRAVAALERSRDPSAKSLLETLADGAPKAPLTREAKAALARMQVQH